jgi:YhcH/YjgK/YiaL family protein
MIIDRLENAALYKGLGPEFERAFRYLKAFTPDIADARYELEATGDYAMVQTYETLPRERRSFESHQEYIDVQYVVAGREIVYYRHASTLTPKAPYDAAKDAIFYEDADDRPLKLQAGEFAIFWPHDAHKPACMLEKNDTIRKVVVKVRVPGKCG